MSDVPEQYYERLGQGVERTADKVGPEVAAQLRALVTRESLEIMAAVLVAWVLGHAFAIGEIIDGIIAVVGWFAIGSAIFSGLDEVFQAGKTAYYARTTADLDVAAGHLAKAIGILGIQAVLAVLFRRRPMTKRASPGPAPLKTPGFRFKPGAVLTDATLAKNTAYCSWWAKSI